MLDRLPAGDSLGSWYARIEAATDEWFYRTEVTLRKSARALLVALILTAICLSLFSCFIISGLGAGFWSVKNTGASPALSAEQATETYGAEQFHIQLTAQAKEFGRKPPTASP